MSYAYSYPSVGDYQFVWIDGEESDGIITEIRLGTSDVQIDGITHTFLNEEIEAWAEAAPDWVEAALNYPRHTITAPWLDPTERVAWLNWTYRAWGVETPVSGDTLAWGSR